MEEVVIQEVKGMSSITYLFLISVFLSSFLVIKYIIIPLIRDLKNGDKKEEIKTFDDLKKRVIKMETNDLHDLDYIRTRLDNLYKEFYDFKAETMNKMTSISSRLEDVERKVFRKY